MSVSDYTILPSAKTPWKFERSRPTANTVIRPTAMTINATPEDFDLSAFSFLLNGELRYFAAKEALSFSAVHATGIGKWLGVGIYSDRDGNILTKGNPDTGDQDFDTEALALASIPSAPAGYTLIAILTLLTAAADWDANTDALDEADLAAVNMLGVQPDRRLFVTKLGYNAQIEKFSTWARAATGDANLEMFLPKQGTTGVVTNPNIQVDRRTVADADVKELRFGAFDYVIDGAILHTEAQAELAFTAAHAVTADKWGAILLQIDGDGLYSTKAVATPQAYANSAAARAALPAADTGNVAIGVLVIEAKNATWTANTDDLVAASDLEAFDIIPALMDRSLSDVTLSVDASEPEDFEVAAFTYTINGVKYSKAAADTIDFSVAHVCALEKFLAILIQIDAAGTISTRVPLVDGRSQTASQGFDTYDLAVAALPNTEAGKLAIGYIVIEADAGSWTANTDDMTTDVEAATFVGLTTGYKNGFEGIENTGQNSLWPVSGAAFAAGVETEFTLPSSTPTVRGWSTAGVGVYIASNTGLVSDIRADWVHRPFPLNGEV